jgi:hypothetical protein
MDKNELDTLRDLVNAIRDIWGQPPVSQSITIGEYDDTLTWVRHEHATAQYHRALDQCDPETARQIADGVLQGR